MHAGFLSLIQLHHHRKAVNIRASYSRIQGIPSAMWSVFLLATFDWLCVCMQARHSVFGWANMADCVTCEEKRAVLTHKLVFNCIASENTRQWKQGAHCEPIVISTHLIFFCRPLTLTSIHNKMQSQQLKCLHVHTFEAHLTSTWKFRPSKSQEATCCFKMTGNKGKRVCLLDDA